MVPEGCLGIASPQAGGLHTTRLPGHPLDLYVFKHAAGLATRVVADALCCPHNSHVRRILSPLRAVCTRMASNRSV